MFSITYLKEYFFPCVLFSHFSMITNSHPNYLYIIKSVHIVTITNIHIFTFFTYIHFYLGCINMSHVEQSVSPSATNGALPQNTSNTGIVKTE